MPPRKSGWGYSSVADLVAFDKRLHKRAVRNAKASIDTQPDSRCESYSQWRTSSPRWRETDVQRWNRESKDNAMKKRMSRTKGAIDTGIRPETQRCAPLCPRGPRSAALRPKPASLLT